MKHLCVIGNSQVGALKHGYQSLQSRSFKARFWSIPGGSGPPIGIRNGKITISKEIAQILRTDIVSNPGEELDISGFDAILLSAVGIPAIRDKPNSPASTYLVAGYSRATSRVDRQIISKAVFRECVENYLRNLNSFQNIRRIASIFHKKIYVQAFPMPTPGLLDHTDCSLPYEKSRIGEFLSWYYKLQYAFLLDSIKDLANVELLMYPSAWMEQGFTPEEYSTSDPWHMNGKFGSFLMDILNPENW